MSASITLEGLLNIARVESLFNELEQLEIQGESLTIDASGVSRVDTAVLQMLVVFFHGLAHKNIEINWLGFSNEFLAASQLLNLEAELKLT